MSRFNPVSPIYGSTILFFQNLKNCCWFLGCPLTVEVSARAVRQHEAEVDVDDAATSIEQNVPVVAVFHLNTKSQANVGKAKAGITTSLFFCASMSCLTKHRIEARVQGLSFLLLAEKNKVVPLS